MATNAKDGTQGRAPGTGQQPAQHDDRAPSTRERPAPGDAGQGPATQGTLSSGYSGHSSANGTGGDLLQQRGSGHSPGDASRVGATPGESDPLAREGVAAGAAGMGRDTTAQAGASRTSGEADTEAYDASDGARAVGGIAGTSGGGSGTTPSDNTRR